MSQPRMIDSDCVEICQRTLLGAHRFVQTALVQQLIIYALARACQLAGVELVSAVFMSSHYHVMIRGGTPRQIAAFTRTLNSLLARGMNRLQGGIGQFWCNKRPQVTPLHGMTVYDRLRYILCNPLRACIARNRREYAGVILTPEDLKRKIVAELPVEAFGPDTKMPESIVLAQGIPTTQIGDVGADVFIETCNQLVDEAEAKLLGEFARAGKTPPAKHTMERRIAEKWDERAWYHKADDEKERERERSKKGGPPRFFAKGAEAVKREERRQAKFQALYRDAMREYCDDPNAIVEFPHGTLKMSGDPRVVVSAERIEV